MRTMNRGFLRLYLLKLIGEAPTGISGYSLMKRIEEDTGFWRPSPGSIYPLLAALEEAGWIDHRVEKDKKVYSLTAKGRDGLARAHAAKEEAMEGVRRSIRVLGELFGQEMEAELTAHLEQIHRRVPPPVRGRLHELWQTVTEISVHDLTPTELNQIDGILMRAIKELKSYANRD